MGVTEITSQAQFDELLASGKTFFVDFTTSWCGPCKEISPHYNKLAEENAVEGVEFYKVNTDDVPDLASEFSIRSIPTFCAYKNGKYVDRVVGANLGPLMALVRNQL